MRRPTLCGDVHTVDDTYLNAAQGTTPVDKEGRLSRVKRMLADSLLLGRRATSSSCSRNFGVPLDEIALTKEGVPVVISKICSYLENNGKCVAHLNYSEHFNTITDFHLLFLCVL